MCNNPMYGQVPEFYGEGDDWNVYYERLEQFFAVNDVPANKQSAFLISVIGSYTYKTLRDLCHPSLPKEKTFAELCDLLQRQFSPQVSIFRERSKFYTALQEPHESISQWYVKVKKLSVDCRFGATLESVLLDKFVTGLRPGPILDRLCEENESITLREALDIAVNKESALAIELPPLPDVCYECCVPPPEGVISDKATNNNNDDNDNDARSEVHENREEPEPQCEQAPQMDCGFGGALGAPPPKRIVVDLQKPQMIDTPPVMACPPMMACGAAPPMGDSVAPRILMRKAMVDRTNVPEDPVMHEEVSMNEGLKKKTRRGCRGGRRNRKRTENE